MAKAAPDMQAMIAEAVAQAMAAVAGDIAPVKTKTKQAKASTVPTMSCWQASKLTIGKDGTFTYRRKDGREAKYQTLSEADAIALVKASVKDGRVFAIRAS